MAYTVCHVSLKSKVRLYHRYVTIVTMKLKICHFCTLAEILLGDVN